MLLKDCIKAAIGISDDDTAAVLAAYEDQKSSDKMMVERLNGTPKTEQELMVEAVLDVLMEAKDENTAIKQLVSNIDMPPTGTYEFRSFHRIRRSESRTLLHQIVDIWNDETSDGERHFEGTQNLDRALSVAIKRIIEGHYNEAQLDSAQEDLSQLDEQTVSRANINWDQARIKARIRELKYTAFSRGDTAAMKKLLDLAEQRKSVIAGNYPVGDSASERAHYDQVLSGDKDYTEAVDLIAAVNALLNPDIATVEDAKTYLRKYPESYTKAPKTALINVANVAGFTDPHKTKKDILLDQLSEWNKTGLIPESVKPVDARAVKREARASDRAALLKEVESRLDNNEMPVFKQANVSYGIHPSTRNPGMYQVTHYTDTGIVGDGQHRTLEAALSENQLKAEQLLSQADTEAFLNKNSEAEARYQEERKARIEGVAKSSYGAKNKLVSQDDYAEIQKKLKAKLGKLNSGIDPELITLGTQAAVYHIEAGARSFAQFSTSMLDDFGDTIKPYLRSWYEGARYYPGTDATGMTSAAEIELSAGEEDATSRPDNLEPDSGVATATERVGGADVSTESGTDDPYLGSPVRADEKVWIRQQVDTSLPDSIAPLPGTDGNLELFEPDGTVRTDAGITRSDERPGGRTVDADGVPSGRKTSKQVDGDVRSAESEHRSLRQKQRSAGDLPVKINDVKNIAETLPALYPEQQDDVLFAETRFFKQDKKGVLFTNGTGTGKTYTGLGIAKRFFQRGKKRILVVVPTDAKAKDWIEDGQNVDLPISQLSGITDASTGAVITTYANFRDNQAVAAEDWDLVIYDESHYLNSNKKADNTASHMRHHEVTNHEKGYYGKAQVLTPEYQAASVELDAVRDAIEKERKEQKKAGMGGYRADSVAKAKFKNRHDKAMDAMTEARALVKAKEKELRAKPDNVKVVMLSASPFAYDKNIDYAEGYLFDYKKEDPGASLGYNTPNPREAFFVEHFGYRMRFNKLTEPEAEVNRDLMERQFHQWMRDQKALSGRVLSVDNDYSRQFIEVQSGIGDDIDRGYGVLTEYDPDLKYKDKEGGEQTGRDVFPILGKMVRKKFDYHYTMRLLEAVKTQGAIKRAKQHIALGRKVVVFHGYNEGQPDHPFLFQSISDATLAEIEKKNGKDAFEKAKEYNAEVEKFNSENPDILALDLSGLVNPINAFSNEFGDRLALFNGRIPKKKRRAKLKEFNRDGSGTDVILLQIEAGKEGLSAHDVTGVHQRVMMQLGLPLKPVDAIQTEGRTFRLGVMSNAIFEYLKVGTSMEAYKFGTTISKRSRTAENLALGDQARDLERSFIEAYLDSSAELPSDNQGVGGKAGDARTLDESMFDAAISFYYGNQKRTSKNKAREGADYFATPEPLGFKMVEWANIKPNEKVLEPSAGHGAISRWIPEENRVMAVEPSGELFGRLSMHTRGNLVNGRFEDVDLHNKFDAIVMNPPFGTGGKQAMDHLSKSFKHLRNGGRIIAIVPEGNSMAKRFDKWYESKEAADAYQMREIKMPAVSFKRAGTAVNARILIIDKYTNKDEVPVQGGTIDLTSYNNINDFFDAIRDMDIADRGEVKEVEAEETEEQEQARTGAEALFSGRGGKIPSPKVAKSPEPSRTVTGASEAKAEVIAGEHTKHHTPIWTVVMKERLDRDVYLQLKAEAKTLGGRYSAYKGNGAIPGFIFKDADSANKFMSAFEGGQSGDSTIYQRGTKGIGMRVSQVQKIVDRIQQKYKGAQAARIVVRKDDVDAFGEKISGKAVKGGFDPATNTITILAHNMDNEADVLKTIRHELFTHYGLRQLMNESELAEFLDLVREARGSNDDIAALYESVIKAYPNLITEPYKLAEEVVARAGERDTDSSFMHSVRALIVKILRRLGLADAPITGVEINAMIDKAARNLRSELSSPRVSAGDLMHAADNPIFYSQMLTVLEKKLPGKGQVGQFKMMINNMASNGDFKRAELEWSGVNEWLDEQDGKITKDEVLAFVNSHQVEIVEVEKGGAAGTGTAAEIERLKSKLQMSGIFPIIDIEGRITGIGTRGVNDGNILFENTDDENGLFPDYDKFESMLPSRMNTPIDGDLLKEMLAQNGIASNDVIEDEVSELFFAAKSLEVDYEMESADVDAPQYADWQLPGGENYAELLLTLPLSEDSKPEFLTELPEGYELITDSTQRADEQWAVTPPGQIHARPFSGRHESEEMATAFALETINREAAEAWERSSTYRSGHWGEPNILAHVRFNERIDADGKRVLFIEETQSDWHQAGRKDKYKDATYQKISKARTEHFENLYKKYGSREMDQIRDKISDVEENRLFELNEQLKPYYDAVPDAPFKTSWPMLVMKRMIRYASENGFDRIAWTTGDQQAERYNLSNALDGVEWSTHLWQSGKKDKFVSLKGLVGVSGDTFEIVVDGDTGIIGSADIGSLRDLEEKHLSEVLGENIAKQILSGDKGSIKEDGLKIGGQGMRGFYDNMLPKMVNKYVKKWGAKVGETKFDFARGDELDDGGYTLDAEDISADSDAIQEVSVLNASDMRIIESFDTIAKAEAWMDAHEIGIPVHSLDVTPKMHAAAMSGQVMFQRQDDDYETARGKVGKKGRHATLGERYAEIKGTLGLRFRQGVIDRYGSLMKLDNTVWKLARGTHHVAGAVEAAFKYGKIKLDEDGALDIDLGSKGLAELLAPLGHEIDDFMFWMIGNRANNLMQEGREHLFTESEIASFMARNQGTMSRGRDRATVYEQARKDMMDFQQSILEIGIATDAISREESDTWNKEFYIPFYRILEDADGSERVRGAQTLDGLTGQTAIKRLKGGTKNLNDPLANVLMNWHHVLSAAMKNQAATATVVEATEAGIMKPVSKFEKSDKAFFIRVAGKKHWFDVIQDAENPIVPPDLVLEALTMMNQPMWNNTGMRALRMFKRIFTIGVTAAPEFRIANLLRDTMHSVAVGKQNYNMVDNIYEGWKGTEVGTDVEKRMMAGGGTIHFGLQYGDDPEAARLLIEEHIEAETVLTDKKGMRKYQHALKGMWTLWRDFGNRIENVNRAALYKKRIGEGATHFDAAHEARDLLDFFQGGSWPAVRFLTQVVPFLNARLQGLDKMYRAGITDDQKKQLYIVLGAYISATLALYLLYRDDDDFKAREEWDRDSYHWFKAPGSDIAFRIPKPFEVGAIGTIAERALEFAIDDDAHIDLFAERLGHVFWQTFEFDPVPQAARPILNVYANKDPFTKRPIESVGLSKLSPSERKYSYTSETAIGASKAFEAIGWDKVNLSPIQIEYLVRGYLGWAGSFSLGAIDNLISRPISEGELPFMGESRPERAIDEWPITRRFVQSLPIKRTKYTTMFYENMKEINTIYADYANYRKLGELEKAKDIMLENRDQISLRKVYASASKKLTQINNQMRRVRGNKKLTSKQKASELTRLRLLKNSITERIIKKTQDRKAAK